MAAMKVLGWLGVGSLLGACSAVSGERPDVSAKALGTAFANDETAYLYFLEKGLANFQAAAIVGNLDQESGVDPTISQSGGGVGRGIAQWSTGGRWDTAQGDNLKDFAAQAGKPMTDLGVQLDFIWFELTTFPDDYGLTALRASTNVTDATQIVEDKFEGCVYANYPECALPSRVKFAMDVLNAYGNDPVPGGGGSAGAGGVTSSGGTGGVAGAATGSAGAGGVTSTGGGTSSAGMPGAASGGTISGSGGASAGTPNITGGATGIAGTSTSTPSDRASESSGCAIAEAAPTKSPECGFGFASALLGLSAFARRKSRHKK